MVINRKPALWKREAWGLWIPPSALNNTSFSSSWHRDIDIYWCYSRTLVEMRILSRSLFWPLPIGHQWVQLRAVLDLWQGIISAWEINSFDKNMLLRISEIPLCCRCADIPVLDWEKRDNQAQRNLKIHTNYVLEGNNAVIKVSDKNL